MATPEGTQTPRRDQIGGDVPQLPPGGSLYVDALQYLGTVDNRGMQTAPLSFSEIMAGCPWADERDRGLIRQMSAAYVAGLKMTDPFAISPMERAGLDK